MLIGDTEEFSSLSVFMSSQVLHISHLTLLPPHVVG